VLAGHPQPVNFHRHHKQQELAENNRYISS